MERPLYRSIWNDLARHKAMVFMSGARQSGKTTLAQQIATGFSSQIYFNWDLLSDKQKLLNNPAFFEQVSRSDAAKPLVILDEIHKYRHWKNYLKGTYDHFSKQYQFLVLGSGRLNVFQKGGDSLAGRYWMMSVWPLTLAELSSRRRPFKDFWKNPTEIPDAAPESDEIWKQLSILSGFPEPYFMGEESGYLRWSQTYAHQLIREDIRNITEIRSLEELESLFAILPTRAGSPLSMASLARDLQVSFKSIRHWINVFDSMFLTFRILPWTRKITRALTKETKLYFYDYVRISDAGIQFENQVAVELARAVSNWNDLGYGKFALHYVRNKEKEEVDFLIVNDHKPLLLVETKLSDDQPSKALLKFQEQLQVPAVQLVNQRGVAKLLTQHSSPVLVMTASRWLSYLP